MTDVDYSKVDIGLRVAIEARALAEDPDPQDAITVVVEYEGSLQDLVDLGFTAQDSEYSDSEAVGAIAFDALAAFTASPSVISVVAGGPVDFDLNVAAVDVRVRAGSPGAVGTSALWSADETTGTFSAMPNATGEGVIVAVIDSGIDYTHPAFDDPRQATRTSRIIRIWDQGLPPTGGLVGPAVANVASGRSYGSEFDNGAINTALRTGVELAHHDFEGHGTHVASIAAGGTAFPVGGQARFVGMAPLASIIAVKFGDVTYPVHYGTSTTDQVGDATRFRDAVMYCLRVAHAESKPVVINFSMGSVLEAGDSLDSDARWIDGVFDPARGRYSAGTIMVKSAGNAGRIDGHFASFKMPPSGRLVLPLELVDSRPPSPTRRVAGVIHTDFAPVIEATIWYRRAAVYNSVSFSGKLPLQTAFSAPPVTIGGWFGGGYVVRAGPSPTIVPTAYGPATFGYTGTHHGEGKVTRPDRVDVRRHSFEFTVNPRVSMGTVTYHLGTYELEIVAPPGTVFYVACRVSLWDVGTVGFRISGLNADMSPADSAIVISNRSTAVDAAGTSVITVASYDDDNGGSSAGMIAKSSSRGPLRDFTDPPLGPAFIKPDIAGPGANILAAMSRDIDDLSVIHSAEWHAGRRFIEFSGTSMASPAVAGIVALLLQKHPTLTVAQARAALQGGPRTGAGIPTANPSYAEAFGSGMIDAFDAFGRV